MPSLAYIARITGLSDELVQRLQSAGFHVQRFPAGEVTSDECLMVVTPEAIPSSPAAASLPPRAAVRDPLGLPPFSAIRPHLGAWPAAWRDDGTAEMAASRHARTPIFMAAAQSSNLHPAPDPPAPAAAESPADVPPRHSSVVEKTSAITRARPFDSFARWLKRIRPVTPGPRRFAWKPALAVAALLIAALALLTNHASTLPRTASNVAAGLPTQVAGAESGAVEILETGARIPHRRSPDDDVVAQDFTRRFDRQGRKIGAVAQVPSLLRNGAPAVQKRVVVN